MKTTLTLSGSQSSDIGNSQKKVYKFSLGMNKTSVGGNNSSASRNVEI